MESEDLVPVIPFCTHHQIEISFISSLNEFGLIKVITREDCPYVSSGQLQDLEKMIRLHYELGINLEGIDAISHLLKRVNNLQEELTVLKNRLKLYERE